MHGNVSDHTETSDKLVCEGERRPFAPRRTNGSKEIGIFVALISGQSRARACLCPKPGATILLTKPRFILEPDFYRCTFGQMAYV